MSKELPKEKHPLSGTRQARLAREMIYEEEAKASKVCARYLWGKPCDCDKCLDDDIADNQI